MYGAHFEYGESLKEFNSELAKDNEDEIVSMEVLMKVCKALSCDIGDIMEMIPDVNSEK